ncbi:hypothetical protein M9Y10_004603 [Tritrichomonas musculus]|uniref:Uncharacterized protein n=1 Tax=Tritrichomonas musculus TaxID=1915356 RepID=A0ABR2JLM6_9EUKA
MIPVDTNTLTANEDVSADTQVLLTTIEGMMNIINTQASLYNDTRKRLVEEHLKKPNLEISKAESFYIGSPYKGPDLKSLGEKLKVLRSRLKQMSDERTSAQEETEKAFKHLNDENYLLREELTKLRKILYSTNSKIDDVVTLSDS